MKENRLTIREIAKMAGVSPTAVSFALNHKNGVSEETREKIMAVIEKTNFQPSISSRRLTAQKSFNIALVYPHSASPFTDLFYYEIANGVVSEFTQYGYNVVFSPTVVANGQTEMPNILRQRDADGAIFLQDVDAEILSALDETETPYVFVDLQSSDESQTNVSIDCEKSIQRAVEYLYENGHTAVAFLGTSRFPNYLSRCFSGYRSVMGRLVLPIYPEWIEISANDHRETKRAMERITHAQNRPTAMCCMSDMLAIQALNSLQEMGVSVPGDISLISIDDIIISKYVWPPLTTISYDKQQMGVIAADLLIKKLNHEKAESVVVDSETIIERRSVAKRNQ